MYYLILLLLITSPKLISQDSVWVTVSDGLILSKEKHALKWEPIVNKEHISVSHFLKSYSIKSFSIVKGDKQIILSDSLFFYIADLFITSKQELQLSLTEIDAFDLPVLNKKDEASPDKKFGLTYGKRIDEKTVDLQLKLLLNTAEHFVFLKKYHSATMAYRRALFHTSSLLQDANFVHNYLSMLNYFKLTGRAADIVNRARQSDKITTELDKTLSSWEKKLKQTN